MAIRVLVVDDSATARAIVRDILESEPGIEVVGTAQDPYVARDKIVELKPDVVCLDVEMPRMDGLTFLRKIMEHFPLPVVMVSSLTQKGAKTTLEALEAGAVDFVAKPHSNIYTAKDEMRLELITKVKNAARIKVNARKGPTKKEVLRVALPEKNKKIIVIGASTGGTEAIRDILEQLPPHTPPIVIVQHMPPGFTKAFAERLNGLCAIEVKEAVNGDFLTMGQALIAPADYHLAIRRSGARYYVEIGSGEKVSGHRPSVDVLFNSAAKSAGSSAVGVILTGMGSDGARGLLALRKTGAKTIGQNEATCIVYGMPKVAFENGSVLVQLPLESIPTKILEFCQ